MKIDHDYLKALLDACEASERSIFYVSELAGEGISYQDEKFVFHMALLEDQGLVEREDGRAGFGFIRGADGHGSWSIVPLRLTSAGHSFIEALRNKEVWATIKRDFKDASISTLATTTKKLTEAYLTKKISGLLE